MSKHSAPRPSGIQAKEYCEKFPQLPSLTLAKKLYKDFPKLYTTVSAARCLVKYYRGLAGNHARNIATTKHLFKEKTFNYNPFNLPESAAQDTSPYLIQQSKTLILSDIHAPYQCNKSLELALQYGIDNNANCILINGDLIDFALISRHEKDWRNRSVKEEFDSARAILKSIREAFPKAKIVYKEGNHDERWEKYLYIKAPEIFDDPEFTLETRLKLGELKIEIVKEKRPVKIGKLTVYHGHEFLGMGGVNPARATFLKAIDSVLVGHFHRSSNHTETTLSGDVISVNSTGCLCATNPLWMPINKWNKGFAFVELDLKTNEYRLDNLKIIKGRIY